MTLFAPVLAGCVKYTVSGGVRQDRSERGMIQDMSTAAETQRIVCGVKGPSPLLNVPGFDIVGSFNPDYMHCALLGVARQFAELWFAGVGEDYYIGDPTNQSIVNERLCGLKPPQCINRPPRALKLRRYWKAAEWQCWVFYYCLPCLKHVLPETYYQHFELFVAALYLLCKTEVTLEDVEIGTTKMTEFVVMTEYLYGEPQMTSNLHTLLHLPKAVLLHGPLWALSCFPFESNMGHILKLVSSSNGVPLQILSRCLLRNNFFRLRNMSSDEVQDYLQVKKDMRNGLQLLGKPRQVTEYVCQLVRDFTSYRVDEVVEHDRVRVDGHVIHSLQYKAPSKRDSTALKLGDAYLRAEQILSATGADGRHVYIMSHVYDVTDFGNASHLKVANKRSAKRLHRLCQPLHPCMYLDVNNTVIFVELCNKYEWS